MSTNVATLQEQYEAKIDDGKSYVLTGKPKSTNSGRSSPKSTHSDLTGYYDDNGDNQTVQSYLVESGDFEDSGLSEEELRYFQAYSTSKRKGQTYVMEKNNMKKTKAQRPSLASKENSGNEYDVPHFPAKPFPKPRESPCTDESRTPSDRQRSLSDHHNPYNDGPVYPPSLQVDPADDFTLSRSRSKSMGNMYDDSSETDSISSRSRSPRRQVMGISDDDSKKRRVSAIIEAINSRNSSPETSRRTLSPEDVAVPSPRTPKMSENGSDNWILQSQPQRPNTLDIPSANSNFRPIPGKRKMSRQELDEVDLGEPGTSTLERQPKSPNHSRQSSLDLTRPRSDSFRSNESGNKPGERVSYTSGSLDQDDTAHLYEHLDQARTPNLTRHNESPNYEELPPLYRNRRMTGESFGGQSNRDISRASSCTEADMYTRKVSSGSQISGLTSATNTTLNYNLTVAVQEDIDADKDKDNNTCSNFYIVAMKWFAALLIAATVLFCVTANKLCLLVIGREYHHITSNAGVNVNASVNASSVNSGTNKEDGKKESILIMLLMILMVPQAISLLRALWSKRKSQPWPTKRAVLWIILGGILEASCLSYLCLYVSIILSNHPEVFLLFVSGLFVVPTIIQVYQSAIKFSSKLGKRRFALFIFAAGLQVTGLTLLFIRKDMSALGDKIGIIFAIGILSLAWSPKLRSLQTQASPQIPTRMTRSLEDIAVNDLEKHIPRVRTATTASALSHGSCADTLETPESLLKPSAREKAALVMSLVLLLVTPLASVVWISLFKLGDLSKYDEGFRQITTDHPVFYYFLMQIFVTFLGYHAAWLACSMYAQRPAFALPLTLATPIALIFIEAKQICETTWLPLTCGPTEGESLYYLIGIGALLLLGQFLSTGYYVWANKGYIMAKASHLFWLPSYTGVLLEPFLLLNRRNKVTDNTHVTSKEITRKTFVFICSTMYHEELYEMEQLLESLHDIDNNVQRGRRHVESHVFFDGCIKADVMNSYVLQLVSIIKRTLNVDVCQAKKIRTPYGMRLEWTLPGGLPITIHLKDNQRVKNKKRWSQVMYMSYVLDYKQRLLNASDDQTFILTTDADVNFKHDSMEALIDYMIQDERIGAVCGRTHPMGNGPLVWYQIFDYAVGHWFMKVANHVFGSVLCCPGCFSLYRCQAVRDVLREYSSNVNEAFEFLTKDMGEDRWFCTLMVERGWRLAYCAAAEDWTYCPQEFEEFYKQRRRWMPSTLANLGLLVSNWRQVISNNENINFAFIIYQVVLLMATLIGPSIVILFIVGGLVSLGDVNEDVLVIFMSILTIGYAMICLFFSQDIQIKIAKFLTFIFAIIMIIVTIGLCVQIGKEIAERSALRAEIANSNVTITLTLEQQLPAGVSTLYLAGLVAIFLMAALMHPKEFMCLMNGIWYLLCLPSGYLLLTIYSVVNMTDRSWGTREGKNAANTANGQNENPLVTLWKLFKTKCACCFNCCQNKSTKSNVFKSRGSLANSITSRIRNRIDRDRGRDAHRSRGRHRRASRADDDSETSSIHSQNNRHSVKPKPRKSKHSNDTIRGKIHSVLRPRYTDSENESSDGASENVDLKTRPHPKPRWARGSVKRLQAVLTRNFSNGIARRETEPIEEFDENQGRRRPLDSGKPTIGITVAGNGPIDYDEDEHRASEAFGEIERGMDTNRGFESTTDSSVVEFPELSTQEGSTDPGYSSSTPPRPHVIKTLPLRHDEPGPKLLPIARLQDIDDDMRSMNDLASTVTTTVDDLINDIYLDMPVDEWLKGDLRPYIDNFLKHGYDTIQFVSGMTEKDLEHIDIQVRGHRQRLKRVITKLPERIIEEGIPADVKDWLTDLGLEEYWMYFLENSYTQPYDLEDLKRFDKEQLKTTFHVKKVAHLNMLWRAVQKLQYANKGQKEIRQARRQIDMLPMDTLERKHEMDPALEFHFWEELRQECLMPELAGFDANKEIKEKLSELRNTALMIFFVANCLWMIIIMVLVKQSSLKTLGVDILGLSFLLVYGGVTLLQFLAMITHRLTTLLHVLARATWICCSHTRTDVRHVRNHVNEGYTQELSQEQLSPRSNVTTSYADTQINITEY